MSFIEVIRRIPVGYGVAIILVLILVLTAFGNKATIISLLASSATSLNGDQAIVFFASHGTDMLEVGETVDIDVRINARVPINAVGTTVMYPSELIEVTGISKEQSFFNLWTEETVIREDLGEVHFSGGTVVRGGFTGVGTILTLTIRAKKAGSAKITFKDSEVYANDGRGKTIEREERSLVFIVADREAAASTARAPETPATSSDLNSDGKTTFADFSIFALQLLSSYNARYDFDRDGEMNLRDLSILLSNLRK